ncbi:Uncharacterized [Syntrophomonas zehnderi OL-4]|uniref:Uncharacterized n=1 Tax=Syntrophomonas zehnderi OL-4 TaxID=690567 RepID=A0A0E4C7Y9_9FIRM|nr:hypothetical protein [Syntrophomonas zehnderi]CFX16061.1 Uncharacterized [Syntrophomonas zehnderi OL-4]
MGGYVYSYSERQLLIYNFIKKIGPSPEAVLEVLFGLQTANALHRLKQSGYLQKTEVSGTDFWHQPNYGYFDAVEQETMAWFVVRLEEAGGKYEGEYGTSPKGNRFLLRYAPGCIHITDEENRKFVTQLEDLQRFKLAECLKWKTLKTLDKKWKGS